MTAPISLLSGIAWVSHLWQECCENPAVFCYCIGCSLVLPQPAADEDEENQKECSNRSGSSFNLSMTSKD